MIDRDRCMSSYLMYRYIYNPNLSFSTQPSAIVDLNFSRRPVKDADDLLCALKAEVDAAVNRGSIALALSGGIDSAILAKLVPKGTKAYTFRCLVPGKKVIDESENSSKWAEMCGLQHEVIDITWNDIDSVMDTLMLKKGAPIHSIETQIYLASLKAKHDGAEQFIFGENADIIYGGMDGLLAEDWLAGDFIERYSYIMPYKALKNPKMDFTPFQEFERNGHIDGHEFINKYFRQEALGTYTNACSTAGIKFVGPYSKTYLASPLDYERIRQGNTKYIVREVFRKLYPGVSLPAKIPMPRPMNEWFADWTGPRRDEFLPHCTDHMTGDQKWMVYALERYLNLLDRRLDHV